MRNPNCKSKVLQPLTGNPVPWGERHRGWGANKGQCWEHGTWTGRGIEINPPYCGFSPQSEVSLQKYCSKHACCPVFCLKPGKIKRAERSTQKHPDGHSRAHCRGYQSAELAFSRASLEHPESTPQLKQSSPSPRMPSQTTFCSGVRRSRHLVQPVEQRGEAQFCSVPAQQWDRTPGPLLPTRPCSPCLQWSPGR